MFLLFNRKKSWNSFQFRWIISLTILMVAIVYISFVNVEKLNVYAFLWCLSTILIYTICDHICKIISNRIHGRDFYLWLRGSDEINDSFGAKNEHVLISDKILSFLLLILAFVLPTISTIIKS